jgi:BMFP domain-containing protein YqiC
MMEIDARNETDKLKSRIETLETERGALDQRLKNLENQQRDHKGFIDVIWAILNGKAGTA